MNEVRNGELVIAVPSGLTTFTLGDGSEFQLDVAEALDQAIEIFNRQKPDDRHGHFRCLDEFGKWLEKQTGQKFRRGQVDFLWDTIVAEYDRSKKARVGEQPLPASTPEPTSTG